MRHDPRHHTFQLLVSFGLVMTTFASLVTPAYAEHITVATLLTNLVWLWE